MGSPFRRRLSGVVACGCALQAWLAFFGVLPALGQQSYRTQRSLQANGFAAGRPTSPGNLAATGGPTRIGPTNGVMNGGAARRRARPFRGWRESAREGPDVVRYFRSLARRSGPVPRTHVGFRASPGAANSPLAHAAPTVAPTALPTTSPNGFPGLLLRPWLPAGALPSGIVTGDFNGDGKLDWVVSNGGDNTLYIYLGNGDGTSQLPVVIPLTGQAPVSIATGDLNGDGKLDLVVAEADTNTVGILLGNGDGTFQPEIELQDPNVAIQGVSIADVDGDGHPDLVIAVYGGTGLYINVDFEVLLNDGSGNFDPPIYGPKLISDGIDEGFSVAVSDLNGDGIPDLLVVGGDAYGTTAKTYFGNGNGTFTAGRLIWTSQINPTIESDIANAFLADLNGDGCADATLAMTGGYIEIFDNDCKGNFPQVPSYTYGTADGAWGLAIADVNGDGHPDIVVGGLTEQGFTLFGQVAGNTLTVRLNDGTGAFGPARAYAGGQSMVGVAVADLKGDGHPAIVTANQDTNTVNVFLNDGSGGYGEPEGGYDGFVEGVSVGPLNQPLTPAVVADVNGDGRPDLVHVDYPDASSNGQSILSVSLNEGNGQFAPPVWSSFANGVSVVWDYVMGDFRKTGQLDFVALLVNQSTTSAVGSQLLYARNLGNGEFAVPVSLPLPYNDQYAFGAVAVGDFNNDGKLDIAVVAPVGANDVLTVFLGNGDGTFQSTSVLNFGSGLDAQAIFVGDANGDGKQDLFAWVGTQSVGSGLYEILGAGDGTFRPATPVAISNLSQLTMADLNHDGVLDVIDIESAAPPGTTPGQAPATVYVSLGQSNGGFAPPVVYKPYAGSFTWASGYSAMLGDFNGDGTLDLALFQHIDPNVVDSMSYAQFLSGNGDGSFTPTFDVFPFGIDAPPEIGGANLLGDNKTAMVETPGLTSAFYVVPAAPAPGFQMEMSETPVVLSNDAMLISLNVPSSSDTTLSLSASDPNILIPVSATVPAGQLSVEVPFTVGGAFPNNHWFSITAEGGGTTAIAYNFQQSGNAESPFSLTIRGGLVTGTIGLGSTPAPGQSSAWNAALNSNGLGTSTFQISCSGLPTGATCTDFTPATLVVEPGGEVDTSFTITAAPSLGPGQYPFQITATDGFIEISAPAILQVGDFGLSLSPSHVMVAPSATAAFTLTTAEDFGYRAGVTLSCSNLPAGATCATGSSAAGSSETFSVNVGAVAAGTYTFTVTGTSNSLTHTASGQLTVFAEPVVSVNQSLVQMGSWLVNTGISAPGIALSNLGNVPLNLSIVGSTNSGPGVFGDTNTCGTSLGAGLSCTITPTFDSASAGLSTGSLTLTDNAANSPQVIPLIAQAVDFSFQPGSGSSPSSTVSAGQAAFYEVALESSQLSGTIQISCSGVPAQATCSLPSQVFTSGNPQQFTVIVSTTARPATASGVPGKPGLWNLEDATRLPEFLAVSLIAAVGLLFALSLLAARRGTALCQEARYRTACCGLVLLLLGILAMTSCRGGGVNTGEPNPGTPAGTYAITVTGRYDGGVRTINLTLIVN